MHMTVHSALLLGTSWQSSLHFHMQTLAAFNPAYCDFASSIACRCSRCSRGAGCIARCSNSCTAPAWTIWPSQVSSAQSGSWRTINVIPNCSRHAHPWHGARHFSVQRSQQGGSWAAHHPQDRCAKTDAQHAHTRTGSSRFFQHNMRPKCPASCLAALLVHTTSSACMLPGNCEPTVSRTPRQICSYQNVDLRAVPTLSQPGIFCEAR